jgi:uncharacterized membrane protein HdeD (DUF308 family)
MPTTLNSAPDLPRNPAGNPSYPGATGDPAARMEAMSACLAKNWWAVAIRGVLAIIFGIVTFLVPGAALASFIILFSAYMLVDGVFAIVSGVRAAGRGERWGLLILEGIVDILAGVAAFLWPVSAVLAFVYLMAAWAIVSGGLMIGAAFGLRITHGRWMLVFAGLVSVIFGIVLAVAPGAGALALTLWAGAYAFVFGIMLVALAFRLRGRRDEPHAATPRPA